MYKVLIIGGNGFIGSHVVDRFCLSGCSPIVFGRNKGFYREPSGDVTYIYGDIKNLTQIDEVFSSGIDVVIHLVSSTNPKSSNDNPIYDIENNLLTTVSLLNACVKYKIKKIIFVSSGGTVYGIPDTLPIDENHPCLPLCSYGIVKHAIENYLHFYYYNYGLNYCVLRVSNPYGIRQNPKLSIGAIAVFTSKILNNEAITIWGDGTIVRDFISVQDIAELCYRSAIMDGCGIFNAGSGKGVSLIEIINIISEITGKKAVVNYEPARSFDVPAIYLDCSKALSVFGWHPTISLYDGIKEYVSWMKGL